MVRRMHVSQVSPGLIELDAGQAHHLRDVLRLAEGAPVEVFDDTGTLGQAVVVACTPHRVSVQVRQIAQAGPGGLRYVIASAVPKAGRADWMIEKLVELGTAAFIPLATHRSVVLPEGRNKLARWTRIATEAAKQSRRPGVMRVQSLQTVEQVLGRLSGAGWYLSTDPTALPIAQAIAPANGPAELTIFIGPEGGWTDAELKEFSEAGLTGVHLTATILRVETAAIAAAAIVAAILGGQPL